MIISANTEQFKKAVYKVTGKRLSAAFFEKIDLFVEELLRWNRTHNLTAANSAEIILFKHVLDSLYFFRCAKENSVKYEGSRLIDIGSGAGFPGLVLAIATDDLEIYLVESKKKKVAFLKHLSALLELEHVYVLNERLENFKERIVNGCEEPFEIGTSRASMKPEKLLRIAKDVIKQDGHLFIWSSISQSEGLLGKNSQIFNWNLNLCRYNIQFASYPEIANYCYSFKNNAIILAKNCGGIKVDFVNC